MLKKILVIFYFFTAFQGFSQKALEELKAVMNTLDYRKFQSYAEHLEDDFSDGYLAHAQWRVVQDIFYNYRETYVQIQENYLEDPFTEKYGRNLFDVKIISHCDSILFYEIVLQESRKDSMNKWVWTETVEATHTDIKRYKNFTLNYEEVYHAPFNFEDLFSEDMNSIYGFSCGMGGGLISFRKEINDYVAKKDTNAITTWLSSAKPVLQLYAIDGILTLKEKGIHFEAYVYEMIQIISIKEGYVSTCSGCEVMPTSIQVISEAILKRHNFKF
jgi:hypothetical protein